MATAKKTGGLQALPLARIAKMVAVVTGERVKKYKDKPSAIKALGRPPKQKIVLALLKTGGATVGQIEDLFKIRRAYARDIISKLTLKGEKIEKEKFGEDGDYLFTA